MMRQPSPPGVSDDLTRIKGIKDTRQQLLRDALGIRSFGDLASASPERIFAAFRAQAQPISRATIEQWIEQARILMTAPGDQSDDEAPLIANPQEWRALAQFGIIIQQRTTVDGVQEYRTNAYHQEADEDQHWAGVALSDVLGWIDERIDPAWRTMGTPPQQAEALPSVQPGPTPTLVPDAPRTATALNPHERLHRLIAKTEQVLNAPLPPTTPPRASAPVPSVVDEAQSAPSDAQDRLQHYLRKVAMEQPPAPPKTAKRASVPVMIEPSEVAEVTNERLRGLLQKHGWR